MLTFFCALLLLLQSAASLQVLAQDTFKRDQYHFVHGELVAHGHNGKHGVPGKRAMPLTLIPTATTTATTRAAPKVTAMATVTSSIHTSSDSLSAEVNSLVAEVYELANTASWTKAASMSTATSESRSRTHMEGARLSKMVTSRSGSVKHSATATKTRPDAEEAATEMAEGQRSKWAPQTGNSGAGSTNWSSNAQNGLLNILQAMGEGVADFFQGKF